MPNLARALMGGEITHDKRGWPHLDCPDGHAMIWLGSRFWLCEQDRNRKGTIWVSSDATFIKRDVDHSLADNQPSLEVMRWTRTRADALKEAESALALTPAALWERTEAERRVIESVVAWRIANLADDDSMSSLLDVVAETADALACSRLEGTTERADQTLRPTDGDV